MNWFSYLKVCSSGMVAFGACILLAPAVALDAFGLMVDGNADFPADFSPEAKDYIQLAHAVMGAVMVGWFLTLRWVLTAAERRTPGAWNAAVGAFSTWFVLDTSYSLVSGFWPNAVLNGALALLFLPGFVGTHAALPAAARPL